MLSFVKVGQVMLFLYSKRTVTKAAVYLYKHETVSRPYFIYQPELNKTCLKMINLRSTGKTLIKKFGFKMISYKGKNHALQKSVHSVLNLNSKIISDAKDTIDYLIKILFLGYVVHSSLFSSVFFPPFIVLLMCVSISLTVIELLKTHSYSFNKDFICKLLRIIYSNMH